LVTMSSVYQDGSSAACCLFATQCYRNLEADQVSLCYPGLSRQNGRLIVGRKIMTAPPFFISATRRMYSPTSSGRYGRCGRCRSSPLGSCQLVTEPLYIWSALPVAFVDISPRGISSPPRDASRRRLSRDQDVRQLWSRDVPGRRRVSSLSTLGRRQCLLALYVYDSGPNQLYPGIQIRDTSLLVNANIRTVVRGNGICRPGLVARKRRQPELLCPILPRHRPWTYTRHSLHLCHSSSCAPSLWRSGMLDPSNIHQPLLLLPDGVGFRP
jgi:hypothetical protein